MEYLAELYILALELEFGEECTKAVYKEIAVLEKRIAARVSSCITNPKPYIGLGIWVSKPMQCKVIIKRNKAMNKLLIVTLLASIFGINSMLPEDCYTDNGKKIDGCVIIDGKANYR